MKFGVKFVLFMSVIASSLIPCPVRAETPEAPPAAAPIKSSSLEDLLKAAEVPYFKTGMKNDFGNIYKIHMSPGVESKILPIIVLEFRPFGDDFPIITMYSPLASPPEGFKHPPAMLKKIAEINNSLPIGSVGLIPESGEVLYYTTSWMKHTSPEELNLNALVMFYRHPELRDQLQPFVDESR